jgi:sterol desaturase/sphingolipid hydroxylase (fatty acid hydroxylase superfamily)
LLFVVYDFVYTPMHRIMHIRSLYPLVHKHHHRQHSPFRGNTDAVNVHPVEYISGEFIHLLAAWFLVTIGIRIHAWTLLGFMIVGGILASLNHTRHDVRIPPSVYDVRYGLLYTGVHVCASVFGPRLAV